MLASKSQQTVLLLLAGIAALELQLTGKLSAILALAWVQPGKPATTSGPTSAPQNGPTSTDPNDPRTPGVVAGTDPSAPAWTT